LKVIWSPKARQRAREAVDFIKEDRPLASAEWLEGLVQRVLLLEEFPNQGRIVPEWGQPDVREVLHPPYRIGYQVSSQRVEILTLSHVRQLLEDQSEEGSTLLAIAGAREEVRKENGRFGTRRLAVTVCSQLS